MHRIVHSPERRRVLRMALGMGAALLVAPRASFAVATREVREVGLHNIHTDEAGRFTYYENGAYVPQALLAMHQLLRDHRCNAVHAIDPALYDMLYLLQAQTGATATFEVISGYRSPQTNAALFATTEGVNPRSLHMEGRAVDVRLPGITLPNLAGRANEMQMGGVGFYPRSGFVHLDTGPVQRWSL